MAVGYYCVVVQAHASRVISATVEPWNRLPRALTTSPGMGPAPWDITVQLGPSPHCPALWAVSLTPLVNIHTLIWRSFNFLWLDLHYCAMNISLGQKKVFIVDLMFLQKKKLFSVAGCMPHLWLLSHTFAFEWDPIMGISYCILSVVFSVRLYTWQFVFDSCYRWFLYGGLLCLSCGSLLLQWGSGHSHWSLCCWLLLPIWLLLNHTICLPLSQGGGD